MLAHKQPLLAATFLKLLPNVQKIVLPYSPHDCRIGSIRQLKQYCDYLHQFRIYERKIATVEVRPTMEFVDDAGPAVEEKILVARFLGAMISAIMNNAEQPIETLNLQEVPFECLTKMVALIEPSKWKCIRRFHVPEWPILAEERWPSSLRPAVSLHEPLKCGNSILERLAQECVTCIWKVQDNIDLRGRLWRMCFDKMYSSCPECACDI
eukprot:Filipodium_phascolosomae@DN8184_c0_g1_i1.p1